MSTGRIARSIVRTITTAPPDSGFAGPGHTAVFVVDPNDFASSTARMSRRIADQYLSNYY